MKKNKKYSSKKSDATPVSSVLDRLATTVKADDKTIILANAGQTIKAAVKRPNRFTTGLSRVAMKIMPARPARKKTAKLNAQANLKAQKNRRVSPPRAKGPSLAKGYLFAGILGLVLAGGYYSYSQNLENSKTHIKNAVSKSISWWNQSDSSSENFTKAKSKKRISSKKSSHRIATKKKARTSKAKYKKTKISKKKSSKVTKKQKKKIWAAKLAKLKKQSQKKYRKASYNYRKNSSK